MSKKHCPDCGCRNAILDYRKGEMVCTECALVLEDQMVGQSSMVKEGSQSPSTSLSKADKGLSTMIGKQSWKGKNPKNTAQIDRISHLHDKVSFSGSKIRSLSLALDEIRRLSSLLRLPHRVRDGSALLYRKARKKGITRGRRMEVTAAASLYLACKIHNIPIKPEDICRMTDVEPKKLQRRCALLKQALGVRAFADEPSCFIPGIIAKLGLEEGFGIQADRICRKHLQAYGGRPAVIAAAAIYLAAKKSKTQAEVANAAGISENSLRTCSRIFLRAIRSA